MYFTRLSLKNIRAIDQVDFEFPASGVTLIEGDNEAGKSTIVDALDAWRSYSYTSNAAQIKSLRPIGRDVSPEVTVGMHVGEYEFELSKRWFAGKKAELVVSKPQTMRLTGKDAETWVKELLAAQSEAISFDALTIRQGGGLDIFDVASIPALTASLAQETDAQDLVADSATGIRRSIIEEYEKYFTGGRGNPTGAYKKAIEEFENASKALEEADQASASYRETLERLTSRRTQLEEASGQLPEFKTRLTKAQEQHEKVERSQSVLRELSQAFKVANLEKEGIQKTVDQRADLVARTTQADEAIKAAQQTHDELAEQLEEVQAQHAQLDDEITQLKGRKQELAEQMAQASDHITWGQLTGQLEELKANLDAADAARDRKNSALTELSTDGVISPEAIAEINQAAVEVDTAEKIVAATVGTITIAGPSGEEEVFSLDAHREWVLGEYVITVDPGTSHQETIKRLAEAREQLQTLLKKYHAENVDAARKGHDVWLELKSKLDEASRDELVALHGRARSDFDAELETITGQIEEIRDRWDGVIDFEAPIPTNEQLEDLHKALETTEDNLRQADNQRISLQERLNQSGLIEATVKLEQAEENAKLLREQLAKEREESSDLDLQKKLAASTMKVEAAEVAQKEAEEQHVQLDPELVEIELDQAKNAVENTTSFIQDLSAEVSRLEGAVQAQVHSEERAHQAGENFVRAERTLNSVKRRALAAQRLKEVVDSHFIQTQRLYAKPYLDALQRTSRIVFGSSVEYQADEDNPLVIQKRVLNGVDVNTQHLSGGAKEQLGILQRIAVAEIVGSLGVPLILDDALGYADSTRISRMNAVLSDAGKRHQIIVLTCVPQRYAELSAQKRYPM